MSLVPGTAVVLPSVLVICRSAWGLQRVGGGTRVELLPGMGSVAPAGGVTVAVMDRVPVGVEPDGDGELEAGGSVAGQGAGGEVDGVDTAVAVGLVVAETKVVPAGSTSLTVARR